MGCEIGPHPGHLSDSRGRQVCHPEQSFPSRRPLGALRRGPGTRNQFVFPLCSLLLPPPPLPQSLLTLGSHTHPGPENTTALEKYYSLLLRVTRIISAAVLARGPQSNVTQGPARRFLTDYRMLIVQVLKRSAGIGGGGNGGSTSKLERDIEDLTTAFMVLIDATGFLQVS